MYNKRKFNKVNDKKVLHKIKKQWVTLSLALFMMIGGSAISTHVINVNADNFSNPQQVTNKLNTKAVNLKSNEQNITNKAKSLHQNLLNNANEITHNQGQQIIRLGANHKRNANQSRVIKQNFKRFSKNKRIKLNRSHNNKNRRHAHNNINMNQYKLGKKVGKAASDVETNWCQLDFLAAKSNDQILQDLSADISDDSLRPEADQLSQSQIVNLINTDPYAAASYIPNDLTNYRNHTYDLKYMSETMLYPSDSSDTQQCKREMIKGLNDLRYVFNILVNHKAFKNKSFVKGFEHIYAPVLKNTIDSDIYDRNFQQQSDEIENSFKDDELGGNKASDVHDSTNYEDYGDQPINPIKDAKLYLNGTDRDKANIARRYWVNISYKQGMDILNQQIKLDKIWTK